MKIDRALLVLGASLAALFAAFWLWQSPGERSRLTAAEVDSYIRRLTGRLPAAAAEEAEFLARLRAWGNADDGRPVYMLNVMSYYDQVKRVRGGESIRSTPAESNRVYENAVMPLAFRLGAYAAFGGETSGIPVPGARHGDLVGADASVDDADRILVVRYPSRRAFFELITDPKYLPWAPYKFAAVKLALVPMTAEVVVPDPRWIAGALLAIVFLAAGWWRAARART